MMAGKCLVETSAAAGGASGSIGAMMAGKWLVETSAAAGGASGSIGGSVESAGNRGCPKVDAPVIDSILE